MKKMTLNFKTLVFFLTVFMISCSDDHNFTPSDEGNDPEEEIKPPIGEENEQQDSFGWIPMSDDEWEKFLPELTDVNQLGWNNKTKRNVRGGAYRLEIPHIFSQGKYGTCVSMSMASGLSMVLRKLSGMPYESGYYPKEARMLSPAFISAKTQWFNNPLDGIDDGKAITTVAEYGLPTEKDYPYTSVNLNNNPSADMLKKALFNGSKYTYEFFRIGPGVLSKELIKKTLLEGSPISVGMPIPVIKGRYHFARGKYPYGEKEFFEDWKIKTSKGLHRMLIIGYDDTQQAFLVLNSYGEEFGGESNLNPKGTPKGCFWIKYDLFDAKVEHNWIHPGEDLIMYAMYTFGVKNAKQAEESLLYEFTGYDYKEGGVEYSEKGIELGRDGIWGLNLGGDYAVIKVNKEGYIKYPRKSVIPETGTIEFDVYIDKGYRYRYKQGENKGDPEERDSNIPIFSNLIERQSEKDNGTESSLGGMQLRISNDGKATFRVAIEDFDSHVIQGANIVPKKNTMEKVVDTNFKFGEWNTISVSYGSKGVWLKVNKSAEQEIYKAFIFSGPGNSPFTIGHSKTYHDSWKIRYFSHYEYIQTSPWTPPIQTPVFANLYGTKNIHEEGFEGYLKAFRTSKTEKDWVISK